MIYLVGGTVLYLLIGFLLFLFVRAPVRNENIDWKAEGALALLIMVFWLPLLILSLANKFPPSDVLK